jgi:hypothetical protein
MNLLVLSHLVHDPQWTERIDRTLRYFGARRRLPRRADDGGGAVRVYGRPAGSSSRK